MKKLTIKWIDETVKEERYVFNIIPNYSVLYKGCCKSQWHPARHRKEKSYTDKLKKTFGSAYGRKYYTKKSVNLIINKIKKNRNLNKYIRKIEVHKIT